MPHGFVLFAYILLSQRAIKKIPQDAEVVQIFNQLIGAGPLPGRLIQGVQNVLHRAYVSTGSS